ncbi:putative Peroxisome biogenesis factor 10 [Cocos nucifera]|uniref:Putative Peroxisome biogenesis factor 10 n=1 Tax=Cocos nucifera TaxID=13894 RepID=A0A8K0HSH8_COCNU|nr:putative Peroxisome biogenesis factor 10 [Cocos nucifera]
MAAHGKVSIFAELHAGIRIAVAYQREVASSYGLPPTPARRALFIVYETMIPYLAERISSRMAAHGIILAGSQFGELYGRDNPRSNQVQSSDAAESSTSTSVPISVLSKFRERLRGLWWQATQKWPTVFEFFL